jgi:DNA-binding NarL/FixJ family response regulator
VIRVLLVDDQAVVRAGFGVILAEQPDLEVVGEAGTGPEAVAAVRRTRPDVVCMDVRMPDGDGLAATRAIVAEHGDDAPAGEGLLQSGITRRVIEEFARRRGSAAAPDLPEPLTERETEVVRLLAQGMSNAEIAAALVVEVTTVKSHLGRAMTKIGTRDRVQTVVWAHRHGLGG